MRDNLKNWCIKNLREDLLSEWNYEKNTPLLPEECAPASGLQIWWKCSLGHEWQAPPYSRTGKSNCGCPICSGKKVLVGYNDLTTTNPSISSEWDFEKNYPLLPTQVNAGSNKKVWWKCENGHSWNASISNRSKGRGCPICSNRQILIGFNDLQTLYPQIAAEWHPTKNAPLTAMDVVFGSSKKVWWMCGNGHEWQAKIVDRTKTDGTGCPFCSGRQAISGVNDLKTLRPDLLKEWNFKRNIDISPSDVSPGSSQSVWWICEKGHEWKAVIANRSKEKATGCPICRQQHHTSFPEKSIAFYIHRVFPDMIENYRPEFLDGKELDIYIPSKSFAIEYDGAYAHKIVDRDIKKDKLCSDAGIRLIHIREFECPIIENSSAIYYVLDKEKWKSLDKSIYFIFNLLSITPDFLIDNQLDQSDIYEFMDIQEQTNSLAAKKPELSKEWHPTKNGVLKPEHVSTHSNISVWWLCEKGHEWKATINSRSSGRKCPYCSGRKIIVGETDLETTHPNIASEWNYSRNGTLKPKDVSAGSERKVWWIGSCGHEWQAAIYSRVAGKGCPFCNNRKLLSGFNDLQTKYPNVAHEWHYEKNGDLFPSNVFAHAKMSVWWKCKKGHEWRAPIYHRTGKDKTGCPICSRKHDHND